MYTMKQACKLVNMSYETLKFYCNEGLIPNVKRDSHNYRIFDDRDIAWIKSLTCLKRCGISLAEMKVFLQLCLLGESSIPQRQEFLAEKKETLLASIRELEASIDYIDSKQQFYQDVLDGKIPYRSNLIQVPAKEQKAVS